MSCEIQGPYHTQTCKKCREELQMMVQKLASVYGQTARDNMELFNTILDYETPTLDSVKMLRES